MNTYENKRYGRGHWISTKNIERASCFLSCCLFGVLAWQVIDPHSFRAFVLGLFNL